MAIKEEVTGYAGGLDMFLSLVSEESADYGV